MFSDVTSAISRTECCIEVQDVCYIDCSYTLPCIVCSDNYWLTEHRHQNRSGLLRSSFSARAGSQWGVQAAWQARVYKWRIENWDKVTFGKHPQPRLWRWSLKSGVCGRGRNTARHRHLSFLWYLCTLWKYAYNQQCCTYQRPLYQSSRTNSLPSLAHKSNLNGFSWVCNLLRKHKIQQVKDKLTLNPET